MRELTIKEQQMGVLDILKSVHSFCIKNDIKYSLAYGTLIGAVRHKGFIPWDNDIDIIMLRKDYDKFVQSFQIDRYDIAFHSKHKNDCFIAYARVYDSLHSSSSGADWSSKKTGLWIDIFPLDNIPSDKSAFQAFYNSLINAWHDVNRMRCRFAKLCDFDGPKKKRLFVKKLLLLNGICGGLILDKFIKKQKHFFNQSTGFVSQLAVLDNGPVEHIPISVMENLVGMPFEDTCFLCVADYDGLLRPVYGDYWQLPPEEDRCPHMSHIKFWAE